MTGRGSIRHNNRSFSAANVDRSRSGQNVTFCNEDLKKVYHELFDEALAAYNAKKKKTRDKIPGLLTHWPPLSRQQQRPRLFTRELLNNSYLMGAALSRRNERKVGLVDCLGKMNDMPGGMCSW